MDGEEAQVPGVRPCLPDCPGGRDTCDCRTFVGPQDDADQWLTDDARRRGYLCCGGAGLRAYYRDAGMIHPDVERRYLPSREIAFSVCFPEGDLDTALDRRVKVG